MTYFDKFLHDESGQAVLEFALLILCVIAITGSMKLMLRQMTAKIWTFFAKKIAAPCPACDAGSEFDL